MNFRPFEAIVILCLTLLTIPMVNAQPQPEGSTTGVDDLCRKAEQKLFTHPDSAFVLAQDALRTAEREHYAMGIANSHRIVGEIFYHQGFYYEALNHLQKAETFFESENRETQRAQNLNQLGLVYYNIRQPDVALARHREALKIYEDTKDLSGMAYTYGCLGRLYEKKQRYPEALDFQHKALAHYEKVNDIRGTSTILENIGSIYEDLEKFDTASHYFQRSLHLNELTRDSLSMIVNLNNLADVYRKTGKNEPAITYSTQALKLARRLNDKYQVTSAYKDLSKVYSQAGLYEEAYQSLEKGRTLYEEIYGEETRRQVALLQTLFELERKNGEIQVLESDRQLNSVTKVSLIAGIVLLALLAAAIISRQRLKIRQDKEVIERKESQQKLMQAELENAHLHERQLQHELENKSKSLTAHTLHIISKNKMMEDIRAKLHDTLQEEAKEQRKKITNLVKLIDHNFVQDKDWDDFRSIFEQVHQNFFEQLQKISSDITASDARLAALIRLNLPSKDIATILGISPDSLRISRYRLRKKLKLNAGDSLTNFILGI
ncbi:tetratricopeptide repeat protein [Chryseolinea lacunae]|uniref:Tetratricopeptide repeat protein n=1 Tax=Chryseolinea lacunae TaxID=2801331 RepID=A0ABS1KZ48_9BACT|nr:tetratricopeptide repeat protein [Chryseolinea lacunae]